MRSQCVEKENPYRCSWFCPHFYPDCRGERIGGLTPGRAPPSRPGWQQGRHAPYLSAPSVIKALDPAPPLQLQEEIKSSASVPRTLTGTHQIFFCYGKSLPANKYSESRARYGWDRVDSRARFRCAVPPMDRDGGEKGRSSSREKKRNRGRVPQQVASFVRDKQ
jgi:hypothetical protein